MTRAFNPNTQEEEPEGSEVQGLPSKFKGSLGSVRFWLSKKREYSILETVVLLAFKGEGGRAGKQASTL